MLNSEKANFTKKNKLNKAKKLKKPELMSALPQNTCHSARQRINYNTSVVGVTTRHAVGTGIK